MLWYILAGEFGTRYKAKVKTADIAPDDQDTVTLYWQDANSGSPSLVNSGIDVSAVNRLTGTVAKNQFVEVEFNPADYAWWIVGIDDPVFLVDFELKNNLTTGGTATAWKFTFSAGTPNIVRNAAHEITVRDPHGQFRGVGQSVRSSGGSRGKAVWVEDSPAQYRGYQIIEMQKPAYLLKYSISAGSSIGRSATTLTGITSLAIIDDGLYMIADSGEWSSGNPTIHKDTDFSIPAGFSGYAVWNKAASKYEALPVQTNDADLSKVQFRFDNSGSKKLEYSTDGGSTWTTILTAVEASPITQNSVDGTNRLLQSATTPIYVFAAGTQGGFSTWHTGDAC